MARLMSTIPEESAAAMEQQEVIVPNQVRKQLKKSRTAPAMTAAYAKADVRKLSLRSSQDIVNRAGAGLGIYLAIGVVIYIWKLEDFSGDATMWAAVDGLYFSIVTMCTVGYGDITPASPATKLYCCAFVLVGFGFIDILLSGMVAYVLERQEMLLMDAVEGGHYRTARRYLVNARHGCLRKRAKVLFAVLVVAACIATGCMATHKLEGLSWLDAFYLSCMSVTTVGYGDHAFHSFYGRLFACVWLLVSCLAVARAFLFLAEERINSRNRKIAAWVMKRQMTMNDLVAADMDNDGFVSKSEYVVHKLRELGKVSTEDVLLACSQFDVLDSDKTGRITLSCLSA